jgi:hypothetical protein
MKKIALLASPENFLYWYQKFLSINVDIIIYTEDQIDMCDVCIIHTSFQEYEIRNKIIMDLNKKTIFFGGSKETRFISDCTNLNLTISDMLLLIKFL